MAVASRGSFSSSPAATAQGGVDAQADVNASMIQSTMRSMVSFGIAAFCEIAGCFAVWSYFRLGRPAWVLIPGVVLLLLFAYALTRVDAAFAGRAYAAYGGIYVAASILWLRLAEGARPDRWDILGGLVCLAGTLIIVFGKR